ncbi:hypothetical protein L484_023185 [Morus notabilis]|uniref:Uncharacterized protein n=1 Tax=Morus notabilis TaxID=981085 RepID=W9S9B3_9ROSA|nr:hypothetical protein L484_023185 [Morus notabilis]
MRSPYPHILTTVRLPVSLEVDISERCFLESDSFAIENSILGSSKKSKLFWAHTFFESYDRSKAPVGYMSSFPKIPLSLDGGLYLEEESGKPPLKYDGTNEDMLCKILELVFDVVARARASALRSTRKMVNVVVKIEKKVVVTQLEEFADTVKDRLESLRKIGSRMSDQEDQKSSYEELILWMNETESIVEQLAREFSWWGW